MRSNRKRNGITRREILIEKNKKSIENRHQALLLKPETLDSDTSMIDRMLHGLAVVSAPA